jgi:hypothetical protein
LIVSRSTSADTEASLIAGTASLARTVYAGLRKRAVHPVPEIVARTVRVRLRDSGHTAPDHLVEVVVTETVQTAADQVHAQD